MKEVNLLTIRKLNYTNRKRIGREHIIIKTLEEGSPNYSFDADLKLEHLNFPKAAQVIIEAYYQTERKRFNFGKIGMMLPPQDRSLYEFLSFSGINFRLIVVTTESGKMKIIGAADRLTPNRSGDKIGGPHRDSILPVETDQTMKEVWRLNFENEQPVLTLNINFDKIKRRIEKDAMFRLLILPQVIRQVIFRMVYVDHYLMEDEESTYSKWITFLERYAGPKDEWPEMNMQNSSDFDPDRIDEWTNSVVEKFSSDNKLLDNAILQEEEKRR